MTFALRFLAAALVFCAGPACTQQFPSRQIPLVVPFAAGGSNDVIARVIGARLQKAFGQPVVIENQSGASGSIGVTRVAKSEPDGHTLVFELLGDLYTLPLSGGAAKRITSGPAFDSQPRYSPDGKRVAFVTTSVSQRVLNA